MDTPSIVATLTGLNVLVVDDAPEMRDSYPRWLRTAGAACTVMGTLEEGHRLLKRATWDALVIDKRLPDGDGHQALLGDPNLELPRAIVAVSGYFIAETELFAQVAGAVILRKPFSLQALLTAIEFAATRRLRVAPRESGTFVMAAAGEWRIAADGRTLEGRDFCLELRRREREIILALWQKRDAWVSTRTLAAEVLGRDDVASLDTIRSHVRYLRGKLGSHDNLLVSDRRFGYRWTG